jgi:hypothetical protein
MRPEPISRRASRGVSLIEALVALAVMAFGLLGVAGMQATLRFNADVAKQRSEAVRMAQEQVETLRGFSALADTAGELDYNEIASIATDDVAVPVGFGNTTFERTTVVTDPGANDPQFKSVSVTVEWLDRQTASSGVKQSVRLNTAVVPISPELSASVGLPGDHAAPQRPLGRSPAIPRLAVDQGDGTSVFTPPGSTSRTWVFSNATGQITKLCNPPGTCTNIPAWLLAGYINFATGGTPTPTESETPVDAVPTTHTVSISVTPTTYPAPATPPECYTLNSSLYVAYYCMVPTKVVPNVWSGQSLLSIVNTSTSTSSISTVTSDDSASAFKVCRYTPADTHTPAGGNAAHPLNYTDVGASLLNQNFLVISAGDGSVVFTCPDDETTTPLVNGNTFAHQPH